MYSNGEERKQTKLDRIISVKSFILNPQDLPLVSDVGVILECPFVAYDCNSTLDVLGIVDRPTRRACHLPIFLSTT